MSVDFEDLWNSVTVTPTSPPITEQRGLIYFAAVCVIIFIFVGISGNLLTIVALARCPRLRGNATAAFIFSLCVADFIFCSINLPFSASRFIHQSWIHGDTLCIIFPFIRYVNVGLSLLSITAITINRYVLIAHPRAYDRIYRRRYIVLMIVFIWIFSIVLLTPTLLGKWGRFGYDPKILNCSILSVDGKSPKTFLFIFGFLLPCVAIVVCYARIFWVVRQSRSRIRKHARSPDATADARQRQEDWRLTRTVLIIFCSFVVCYLPITIVKVADHSANYPSLHLIGYILIFMSACINPIIYGLTNSQYRQAYKATLLCRRSVVNKSSSLNTPDSSGTRTCVSMVPSPQTQNVVMNNEHGFSEITL